MSLTQLVLAVKQFLTSFNMYSVKPAVEPWTQILSTLGNSNQKQTICLFVRGKKSLSEHCITSSSQSHGKRQKIIPSSQMSLD